jgi:hypothetical protein
MTLRELTDGVLEHFNYSTDGPSDARQRVKRHLNEWHRRILAKPGMDRLRQSSLSVSSVASTPTIAVPESVGKILRITDASNRITLQERFFDWYRFAEADPTSHTGTPTVWVPMGDTGCAELISGISGPVGIWAVSTSASDTQRITIEGVRGGGYVWSDTVILTGTTRVQVGNLDDWEEITKVTLDMDAVGSVGVYDVSVSGTAKATIPPGKRQSHYRLIALWPTPAAVVAYTIDYQRNVLDMTAESDTPLIPDDFHWLLDRGAKVNEYERTDDKRLGVCRLDLERGIAELRASMATRDVFVPARTVVGRISRINGWCPADTVIR